MRIAIPVTQGTIPNHLGHGESFLIADVDGQKILNEQLVPNPGHGPGGPPPLFIARSGVDQVLAWGMPDHAVERFHEMGIRVQLGATGDAKQALRDWLAGTIQYTRERLDAGNAHCEHDEG